MFKLNESVRRNIITHFGKSYLAKAIFNKEIFNNLQSSARNMIIYFCKNCGKCFYRKNYIFI